MCYPSCDRVSPTMREATAGIFLWPARGLDDAIQRDMFKHNNFSQD